MHLGWSHWGMNMAGLMLVFSLTGPALGLREWLLLVVFSSLAVSIGLLALNPEMHWYVGFSGALHGLLVAGAVASMNADTDSSRWIYVALLAAVVAKLTWEQLAGAMPGSAELAGGPVVVDSHLYGAIGGLLFGVGLTLLHRRKPA